MSLSKKQRLERDDLLRAEVERLSHRSHTDEGWKTFLDKEVDDDTPFSEELVEDLAELFPGYDLVSRRPPSRRIRPSTTTEDRQAYEDAMAWFASRREPFPVERFRTIVLGGHLLPPPKARIWLNTTLRDEAEERGYEPASSELVSIPLDTQLASAEARIIQLRDPVDGLDYWARVEHGESNAGWLRSVAIDVVDDIGWTTAEATLWVITGLLPSMAMIRTVFHPSPRRSVFGERIEMTIDPATSPQEVSDAYAHARSRIVGKRVRLQGAKHLKLATFMDQRPDKEPWAESMRRWNAANPPWRYSYTPQFARDASQARRRFLEQRPFAKDQK